MDAELDVDGRGTRWLSQFPLLEPDGLQCDRLRTGTFVWAPVHREASEGVSSKLRLGQFGKNGPLNDFCQYCGCAAHVPSVAQY